MRKSHIQSVLNVEGLCQIVWTNGHLSDFQPLWLRDNCPCPICLHSDTRERILDIMDVDFTIELPTELYVTNDQLKITWQDGHESNFTAQWLMKNCYSDRARAERRPTPKLWGQEIINSLPEIEYADVMNSDEGLLNWLDKIVDYGFALIRNTPTVEGEVVRVAERVSYLRETNFGRDFDVISKINPNNVAYTALTLQSHTDLPNWELPPGTQFLHCLEFEADGGESTLVDGFKAARSLQKLSPSAYDFLKTQEIPFRFHDPDWDIRWSAPTINCDTDDNLREIRYHAALTAPLDIPADRVMPFYKAYRELTEVIRAPENILKIKLAKGDLLVFNNRRALHGRMSFDPNSGPRHLQGCYVDNDAILSKRRILQQKLG